MIEQLMIQFGTEEYEFKFDSWKIPNYLFKFNPKLSYTAAFLYSILKYFEDHSDGFYYSNNILCSLFPKKISNRSLLYAQKELLESKFIKKKDKHYYAYTEDEIKQIYSTNILIF